ncbi:glycosyltransferase family 2 protein [Georgenia yuyongxinii]|uniref:glycosyltransferase family 2 protein n=1 Tax=Georgenia yuyongxinii TaxID=2589797 RepID=UPI001C8F7EA7|nr:glycosyltransferase [Georgenia yuyongxinii]
MRDVEDARVTVVVASRNRRAELLASLARHRAPVVYVDNHSTDGSVDAVRERLPHVCVIALPRNLGAYARTIGVSHVTTPFVAFADDDSWWAPGALTVAADVLAQHPRLALVGARILVGPDQRLDPVCLEMAASPLPHPAGVPGEPLLGFVACAAMVRTEAFRAAGGFDSLVRFPGEEERLALDLAARGWALTYVDDAVVHHHPSPIRHGPAARQRAVSRSSLLTAVMRLPWRQVAARTLHAVKAGGPRRAGVVSAARDLPAALRMRRRVPGAVVAQLALLEGSAGPGARTPAPTTLTRT